MKFIKRYGVVIALVIASIFSFNDFGVYASAQYPVYEGNYLSYYNASGDVDSLNYNDMIAYAIANETIHYVNGNQPSISFGNLDTTHYFDEFYNNYGFELLSNCPYLTNGNTYGEYTGVYDINGWNTIIFRTNPNNANAVTILRIKPNSNIALLNGIYLVSDEPLDFFICEATYDNSEWFQTNLWQGYATLPRMAYVNTVNANINNLYTLTVPNSLYSYNVAPKIAFTDLDMYYSGDDYYNFTLDSFDFDNTQDYFNYNYIKTDGQITNPNDPVITPVNQTAISNLMFRDSTFYACSSFKHILHYNRFVFNEYQLTNPENFVLKMNYQIIYKDDYMNDPVTLIYQPPGSNENGYTYDLQLYLGYLTRFGNPSCLDLSSLHFKDSNGYTLDHYIRQTMSSITNIDSNYANSDNILNNPIDDILSGIGNQIGQWIFGAETNNTYKGINQLYQSHLQTFKIYGSVEIAYKDNPLYISGQYSDSFDFISDSYNVESNSNQVNNYPSDQQTNLPAPSGDSSGGSNINTGGGSVANAYGGNITFNGIIQRVFEPFALDTVTVAGVGDNWNYMIRSIQDDSENGFWGVLEKTYKVIPDQVWGWLIAAVSAILGCAVFKFYITSIRC